MKTVHPLRSASLIAGKPALSATASEFRAANPVTGESLEPAYELASNALVDAAASGAAQAFESFRETSPQQRAALLEEIAVQLERRKAALLERYQAETGLQADRAASEFGRTCVQLRLFAEVAIADSWRDFRVDPGIKSAPSRPELRSCLQPIGPVAVFGPANFPLAFAAAGGDTASALAVGCPVVVKAHSSHPGVSEICGAAVSAALEAGGLDQRIFSLIFGSGRESGSRLVTHQGIRAVGFTGSRNAGLELWRLCALRSDPIPFFGELASQNPVLILPGVMESRAAELATDLHGSVTMGVGQFCTRPSVVLVPHGVGQSGVFLDRLRELMESTRQGVMLNPSIRRAYVEGAVKLASRKDLKALVRCPASEGNSATPVLSLGTVEAWLSDPLMGEEIFGPAAIILTYKDISEIETFVRALDGQLTVSIHGTDEELRAMRPLVSLVETKAGRIVCNGFPTGVLVSPAMVHGGPFPATTDSRFTAVGTAAVRRWIRPVCYQNIPIDLLPRAGWPHG